MSDNEILKYLIIQTILSSLSETVKIVLFSIQIKHIGYNSFIWINLVYLYTLSIVYSINSKSFFSFAFHRAN